MDEKLKELQKAAQTCVANARAVAQKAHDEGRPLSEAERVVYDDAMTKGRGLVEQIKVAKADQAVLADAKSLAEQIGDVAVDDVDVQGKAGGAEMRRRIKNLGLSIVEAPQFKDALAKALGGGSRVPEGVHFTSGPIPVKSLFTGGATTSAGAFVVPEQTGIVEMLGRRELTIRDLISVRRTGSDAVEFVRQTAHTNNAAPVPEAQSTLPIAAVADATHTTAVLGGLKPEGAWTFERDTAVVKTIAEWVPATKRALADVAALEGLIDDELRKDIAEAEESQILAGSGTGENLEGVLNTSGTQAQAWDTDLFTTTRKAITKARLVGRVNPSAFVFNPAEDERIDLSREDGATGPFFGGGPFGLGPRTLWGVPRVTSEAVPAGTFILADWSKAVLWDREETTVNVTDSHADFFTRNLVAILAEERVAFAVTRPSAFVIGDATA